MRKKHFPYGPMTLVLAAFVFLAGWFSARYVYRKDVATEVPPSTVTTTATEATKPAESTPVETTVPYEPVDSISVAIFPNLPDLDLAQNILAEMWAEIEPDVALEFVYWNCYSDPYPEEIDVISFDALFMDYMVENNYIQPMDINSVNNTTGILPFAMDGARYNGDLYGLPFLACSYFLVHYAEDEEMCQVQNFGDLYDLLMQRKEVYYNDGLYLSYSDYVATLYLDALMDYNGTYTTYDEAPSVSPPKRAVSQRMSQIKAMMPESGNYGRGQDFRIRFARGEGSAVYSYSESMYYMQDILDQLTIRSISYFNNENIPLYFADIACVGAHVDNPLKKELCNKLINLLASVEYQQELCYGSGDVQYLLPAREQVYISAMRKYPMYGTLYDLVTDENNRIFRFGADIYDYMYAVHDALA